VSFCGHGGRSHTQQFCVWLVLFLVLLFFLFFGLFVLVCLGGFMVVTPVLVPFAVGLLWVFNFIFVCGAYSFGR